MLQLTKNELLALSVAVQLKLRDLEKEGYPKEEHEYTDLVGVQHKIENAYNNKEYVQTK